DPRAASHEEQGPAERDVPDEVAADRPTQLQPIAYAENVGDIWRDLAIFEAVDRQRDPCVPRCRSDGVAALRLVAVLRRQPHVHVLTRAATGPPRDVDDERP